MDNWLPSLITETPQAGYELAITLSRKGVGYIQSDPEVKKRLREDYANNADSLTLASQVIVLRIFILSIPDLTSSA